MSLFYSLSFSLRSHSQPKTNSGKNKTDQPTYYHFHIHIVHVALEAGATQAVGKALSLDNIVSQLETMAGGGHDDDDQDEAGMQDVDLTFTLGEASELWTDVFLPLKEGRRPVGVSE